MEKKILLSQDRVDDINHFLDTELQSLQDDDFSVPPTPNLLAIQFQAFPKEHFSIFP